MVALAWRGALALLATSLIVGGLVGAVNARRELGDGGLVELIGPASGSYGARQHVLALDVATCRTLFQSTLGTVAISTSEAGLESCSSPVRSYLSKHPMDAYAWLLLAILSYERYGAGPEALSLIERVYATGRNDSRGLVSRITLSLQLDKVLTPEIRNDRTRDLNRAVAMRLGLEPLYALITRDRRAFEALKLSIRLMDREEQDFLLVNLAWAAREPIL